jgi:hypothetical protein
MTTEAFEKGRQAARESIARMRQAGASIQGQAICWFRREDWPRWQAIDPMLEPDYDYWLGRSEGALAEFQDAGVPVVKILVDPDDTSPGALPIPVVANRAPAR